MTDVLLRQTNDGGDITFANGQAVMSDGLETAAYLSLFGGNEDDSGGDDTEHLQWWGNINETEPAKRYRSETQFLLASLPLVPANRLRIKDAVERDLAWMVTAGLATAAVATVTLPALNTVQIDISIEIQDEAFSISFTESTTPGG